MQIDDIAADLYRIACQIGELDEETVRRAAPAQILALPRYAASGEPYALLIADIEHVIATIPDGPLLDDKPRSRAKTDAKGCARLYFSLEAPGSNISHRRSLAGKPGGSGIKWMNMAIIYRVAIGLLVLDSSLGSAVAAPPPVDPSPPDNFGYHLENVHLYATVQPGAGLDTESIDYALRVVTQGPHIVLTDLKYGATRLEAFADDGSHGTDGAQLLSIPGERGSNAALLLDGRYKPGASVRMRLTRKYPPYIVDAKYPERESMEWVRLTYRVEQPVDVLNLEIDKGFGPTFQLTKQTMLDLEPEVLIDGFDGAVFFSVDNPDVGTTYVLEDTDPPY